MTDALHEALWRAGLSQLAREQVGAGGSSIQQHRSVFPTNYDPLTDTVLFSDGSRIGRQAMANIQSRERNAQRE